MPGPLTNLPTYGAGHVLEAKTGGYLVQSRSTRGVWYLVWEKDCSCKAGLSGSEVCWHRTAVRQFVKMLAEQHKRPSAPPNISALVD